MKTLGFQPAMPAFLNGKTQLSVDEANRTRFVTKTRWAIESGIHVYVVPKLHRLSKL